MELKIGREGLWIIVNEETLDDVFWNHSDEIAKLLRADGRNAAGSSTDEVWFQKNENGVEFHVHSYPDDGLIGFDPTDETNKNGVEGVFEVIGEIPSEMLPKGRHDIEVRIRPDSYEAFNPYTDYKNGRSQAVGIFKACAEKLTDKKDGDNVVRNVNMAYPSAYWHNFQLFLKQTLSRITLYNIKDTAQNRRRKELMAKCVDEISEVNETDGLCNLYYHWTSKFFSEENMVTSLRYYRNKCGKTQQQVADEVDISLRQYIRYEKGDSDFSIAKKSVILATAAALCVDAEKMFNDGHVRYMFEKNSEEEGEE